MARTFLPPLITDDRALGGSTIERSLKFQAAAEELNLISDEFFELRNHNSQYTSALE